ncbi:MAG: response regulator [Myxococcaceae bacterium]|nr:response regulator [Myxococcaceae bacterium]MCI0672634.1 response regulator [Myxococcaceae bacterium]
MSLYTPARTPDVPLLRVLVVDDSEFVHQIYRVAFRRLGGCTLQHAHDGREALELLRQAPVDLLVLDIQMPHVDGVQVAQTLPQLSKQVSMHVLVSSTEVDQSRVREALGSRPHTLLPKPFTLERVLEVLGALLPRLKSEES